MPAGRRTLPSMSRPERIIVALLVASIFVNYIDRANLSIAAPVLEKQLRLSSLQIGSLLSAFFWTYAFLQLFGVAGWVVDRFPVGRVFAWGYFSWCAATIATGCMSGFIALYAIRLLLGVGECITYPCYSRIFAEFPEHHRGRANALIDAGTKVGPAFGTFIGGFLLIHFGWRMMFIVLGAVALVWLLPWIKLMPHSRREISGRRAAAAHFRVAACPIGLGHVPGAVLRELLLLFPADLASHLFRPGTQPLARSDDAPHFRHFLRHCLCHAHGGVDCGSPHRSRHVTYSGAEKHRGRRPPGGIKPQRFRFH